MIGRIPVLAMAVWVALALIPQTEDTGDAQVIEKDYSVTSVEGRQRAVADLRNSVEELRNAGQVIEATRTLNRVGRFQIRMAAADEAVTTFQQSLQLLEQQPDPKTQIDSLNGLAFSYGQLSKCELAEPSANQALTLSKQNSYVAGEAEALLILSDCQNSRDHALALRTAQESLALWKSIDRKRGVADTHVAIAHYQMTQHNLVECAKSLDAALNIYRELNDVVQQADVLIYFGYIEYRNAAWQSAMAYYIQAQSLIDKDAEPFKMGRLTIGLGDAFLESGMPDVALPKYKESLDYFRITKNQRALSILKWSIGKANYFWGRYDDAINSLQTARSEAQSSRDTTLTAFCDDFLGRTYAAQNNHAAALSHFQAAFDGYSKATNIREAARILALMGRLYEQQGSFQKARDNYQTALATFRSLSDRINESATLYAIGNLELQENNLDQAANYLQKSIEITEEMRRVSSSSDLTSAFSARVYDRYETYIDCLMRKHSANPTQQYDVRAFETSESARGRSLAELLHGIQTNLAPGIDPQLAEREKSLRQSLRVKENYKISLLAKQDAQALIPLESEISRLQAEYKQVTDLITSQYPAYREINRPTGWDLKLIQEQVVVDDETLLVEYSLGKDRSYAWVVSKTSITSHMLPAEATIKDAATEVYRLLTSKPGAETEKQLNAAVHKLSAIVLSPVIAKLNQRRIIVVADGELSYIPFQILHQNPDKYEPLVASCEVITAPSASILGQLRQETTRRRPPARALAAFGDPVFISNYAQHRDAGSQQVGALHVPETDPWRSAVRDIQTEVDATDPADVQPLLFSRVELANLREVGGADSLVATGFDATREKLAEVDLRQYAILHIATHGVLNSKNPEKSGLLLSMVTRDGQMQMQNGFLGLEDVYRLHAPVDLVVLSACRTALGKDVRGEGLIGLTRGFMYAGASSVVASLWEVDDEATAELMKRFYTNMLQEGMPPAAALRAAQNSIRQQPQWSAPYYWAAFTLQGDFRQIIRPMPHSAWESYRTVLLVGALATLLGIAFWLYFRRRAQRISRAK